ncbi:MAG TPA: hypothetical protein VE819_07245 [Steroidobacteraceae bacterium]|jgi:hypothetical protein|nr:hypothetical protein [Steroidobacteraceae bacterium]
MGTSFNNQWVLARARSRQRERAAAGGGVAPATGPAPTEGQESLDALPLAEPREPRAKRHAGPPGSGLAFPLGQVRKHPRWIDRDT